MKRKTTANIVMIAVIIAIAVSGIAGAGYLKGWFDKPDDNTALLTDFRGIVTFQRDGVAYAAAEDTVLREGDRITCDAGATVKIVLPDGYLTLGQNADAEITNPKASEFAAEIKKGEAFIDVKTAVQLSFDGKQTEIGNSVASLSVRKGAQSISVYYGTVDSAESGQMLEWIGDEKSVRDFSINSLNDFNISQIRKANDNKALIFSDKDLDKLEDERFEQMHGSKETTASDVIETTKAEKTTSSDKTTKEATAPTVTKKEPTATTAASTTKAAAEKTTKAKTTVTQKTTKAERTTKSAVTVKAEKTTKPVTATKPAETAKPVTTTKPVETTKERLTCTVSIRCDTILNNMDDLDPAKAPYVPDDGVILREVTVEFTEGETVFDVLNRACKEYGIPIEYSWTPMYDSYYIEGINNLYEFDCGVESGWMYKVNGWFPNYGCSSYYLTGGETIVWCYTCEGLGEDVDAERWE